MAVNQYGIHYVCGEIWENMSAKEIADEIIRMKTMNVWRIDEAEVDPLTKGDRNYVDRRYGDSGSTFMVLQMALANFGITLDVGSKDEKSYIRAVEEWLKGPNGIPLLYIFRSCEETIKQVSRWTYENMDAGHFPECIGRFSQMNMRYTDPQLWDKKLQYAEIYK
jgi:hypothetical protein